MSRIGFWGWVGIGVGVLLVGGGAEGTRRYRKKRRSPKEKARRYSRDVARGKRRARRKKPLSDRQLTSSPAPRSKSGGRRARWVRSGCKCP